MLKESDEKGFFTMHVGLFDLSEYGFDGMKVSRTSEFVKQCGVGRVIVFVTELVVMVKKRQSLF